MASPDNSVSLISAITIAREQLKIDEGLRLIPYKDSTGHLTIGYGHNLDAGISQQVADYILDNDTLRACRVARAVIGPEFFDVASSHRQAALINMAFNLGSGGLVGFHAMINFIRQGQWDKAADAALSSKWASQVGTRATRIAGALRDG